MDLQISGASGATEGRALWGGRSFRCTLGRAGIRMEKGEGDGATPTGRFLLRRVLYRPDRLARPETGLPVEAIAADDGWCDDPADPAYNRPVKLPYAGRHEKMWREDALYDVVVVLGHNDDPVIPGQGSAVFLHLARPDHGPTEGCVGLALPDLLEVLAGAKVGDCIEIHHRGTETQREEVAERN